MPLASGQTLAHYQILSPLGSGAMGEVWRARDTQLERDVAIKALPEHFAADDERLQRFEREAKAIASLNHPAVAQIYGVDQIEDTCFLVLELVPGETLGERLSRGALPLREALDVCAQIADGLEAAHESGVIHRDLKPANVLITPEGHVKLLDFGLAKPVRSGENGDSTSDSVLSTEAGRMLGTPTYMAPEQARGKPIDRRVDVWAFGCVLFECLSGQRAFAGESLSDVLVAVLENEPDWSVLPPLPPRVEELLRRCLEKDARTRLRDLGEARILLGSPDALQAAPTSAASGAAAKRAGAAPLMLVLLGLLLALPLTLWWFDGAALEGPVYLSVPAPPDTRILFSGDISGPPVISPDGTMLAFCAAEEGGTRRLWVRRLDQPDARELPRSDNALFPFWSADSQQIGYFADRMLRRYHLATDTLHDVAEVLAARGGAWAADGRIVYTANFREGLMIVDPEGGAPQPLTEVDRSQHTSHRWPVMIPGTRQYLFAAVTSVVGEAQNNAIYLGTLDDPAPPRRLMASNYSAASVDGWLLYVRDDTLFATRLDSAGDSSSAQQIVLARGLAPDLSTWHGQFSVSDNGVLALHRPGVGTPGSRSGRGYAWSATGDRVAAFDAEGRRVTTYASGMPLYSLALRPDGRMLAMDVLAPDGFTDIWLHPTAWVPNPGVSPNPASQAAAANSVVEPTPQRLTFLPGPEFLPTWSPDGSELAFRWDGDDTRPRGIYSKRVGGGSEQLLRDSQGGDDHPSDWTRDGRYLIVTTDTMLPSELNDIVAVPLDGGPDVPLVTATGAQFDGRVSPDGRWLAYCDLSAEAAIYVVPFAPNHPGGAAGRKWLLSEGRGYDPRWSHDGDELYYVNLSSVLHAVDVDTASEEFHHSPPRSLFVSPWTIDGTYDVTPESVDGSSAFMFTDREAATGGAISLILNWPALLEER
ncbi:MAG: hypothetical protein DHS20C15_29520 [Planctomycetota bacterium]|nr:MAG: hypothetical protein DHS20C15_29520 [Planctomycetota bacterium]